LVPACPASHPLDGQPTTKKEEQVDQEQADDVETDASSSSPPQDFPRGHAGAGKCRPFFSLT
jgi:hypothetical protein